MQLVDIGIMPYKNSPYNDAVFPLKLFEFLAAGKPVVGCNLSSTSKIKRPFVYEYVEGSDPADFIAACDALLAATAADHMRLCAVNWPETGLECFIRPNARMHGYIEKCAIPLKGKAHFLICVFLFDDACYNN